MKSRWTALLVACWTTAFVSLHAAVTPITSGHADLRATYTADGTNHLAFVVADEEHGVEFAPDECALVVGESARLVLPAGTPFGNEGDPLWVLPQSGDPELPFIGLSTEEMPLDVFSSDIAFRLVSVRGPGAFFAWRTTAPGVFAVAMDSTEGVGEGDRASLPAGSHMHYNFGFTAPGIYRVTMRATGRRTGEAGDIASADTVFEFRVLPLPSVPVRLRVTGVASNGDLAVEVSGNPGTTCELQASTDLVTWRTAGTVTLSGSTANGVVPASGQSLFVRAVLQ